MQDLRFAVRQLLRQPAFTAATVLILALGIGATTGIVTLAYGILFKPLPLPDSGRLVSLWERGPGNDFGKTPVSAPNYLDWKSQVSSFRGITCWQPVPANVGAEGGMPERWAGATVHEDFFSVVGVAPVLGSVFTRDHWVTGQDGVVVISHGVWQERFQGDPAVVGRTIQLNGMTRTILGVMPAGFQTPAQARVWMPKTFPPQALADRGYKHLYVLGRLADGISAEAASADLEQISARLAGQFPETQDGWSAFAHPLLADGAAPVRRPLLVLTAAVAVLLLMACVNVANLLLARSSSRLGEMALRAALGAERRHLLRQLATESLLLAAAGGVAGILIAAALLKAVLAHAPPHLPRLNQVSLDPTTLAFALGTTAATALLFGFAPAWRLARTHPSAALRESAHPATRRTGRLGRALVAVQAAAAVTLLVAAGLLLRSLEKLLREDPGFQPESVMTVRLELPRARYGDSPRRQAFTEALLHRLAAVPGVQSAGITSQLPLQGWPQFILRIEGRPSPAVHNAPTAGYAGVSADFFRTLGIPLLQGRAFTPADRDGSPLVCAVNQAFARRHFQGENAVGRRIEVGFSEPPRWMEIVGVTGDTRSQSLEALPREEVFVPIAQQLDLLGPAMSVAIRTLPGTPDLSPDVRQAVWSIDRDQPLHQLRPMSHLIDDATAQRRFTVGTLGAFAGLALILAAAGLYGILAYSVSCRRRELGIRMALGAQPASIVSLVLREGLVLAATGLIAGTLGALAAGRILASLLYATPAADPTTFLAIAALFMTVALAACWFPARQASAVDPLVALRTP